MNIRKLFFWTIDKVRGNIVKNQFEEIKNLMTKNDELLFKAHTSERLELLLKHIKETTKYYAGINVEAGLDGLPIVNKNIIRDNLSEFESNIYSNQTRLAVVTSGSTGTPFRVFHDNSKKLRNTADTIYFSELAGFEIGVKLYYMKIWTSVNSKSKKQALKENIRQIDVTQLSDANLKQLVQRFKNEKCPFAILSYASALETICKYLDENEPDFRINKCKSVIAMSESLTDYTKNTIKKYFGVFAISRYSNVENGIIAQRPMTGSNEFIINRASYIVEIIDENSDCVLPEGLTGRIVVTDLYNKALPMLRYDTGDIGRLGRNKNGMLVLENVEGRKMDMVYDTSGNLVSSFTITNNMWLYTEIKQYQFIQKSKNQYLFKLNIDNYFTREEQLINEFKSYFGADAEIEVEYVDEIPLLNSGKRRKVVNMYKT